MRIQLIEREAKKAETATATPATATAPCPSCGQRLVVPTEDLCRTYRCPRCQADHLAGDVIDLSTPVAAIAVGDAAAPRMNPWARTLVMPRVGVAPRAAVAMNDVATPTNPWSSTLTLPRVRAGTAISPAAGEERSRTPLWRAADRSRPAVAKLRARVDALLSAAKPRLRACAARLEGAGRAACGWARAARSTLAELRRELLMRKRRIAGGGPGFRLHASASSSLDRPDRKS